MKTIIEENKDYTLYHHTGKTRFRGCQCFKDCNCNKDFISENYDYYTVKKRFNKPKTTRHNTLEEAKKRIDFLNTLLRNYYQKPLKQT